MIASFVGSQLDQQMNVLLGDGAAQHPAMQEREAVSQFVADYAPQFHRQHHRRLAQRLARMPR